MPTPPGPEDQKRNASQFHWLRDGDRAFRRMLEAIDQAQSTVCLETYTFTESLLGNQFLEALVAARKRGLEVKVVVDFFGSRSLRSSFWRPLTEVGGQFRWFNPWSLWRLGIRDHRKILVCDNQVAFLGGFNISPEYEGDGVRQGWRDLGLEIRGPLAESLQWAFHNSFERADTRQQPLPRLRRSRYNHKIQKENWSLLLSGPGRGNKFLKQSIADDFAQGQSIQLMAAYFLPTWRMRRELRRAARKGHRVEIMLSEKSDVILSKMATQCLYQRFLKAGTRIFEYQPQVLHAKLIIVDDCLYVGSSNLDARSLHINYEILLRIEDAALAQEAREIFQADLNHCREVRLPEWKKNRPFWKRWIDQLAYVILARLDPYLARLNSKDTP